MKKRAKKATVGERIADAHERWITNGKYDNGDPHLARRIDAALRRAFRQGRCTRSCFKSGRNCDGCKARAAKYGVKL